MNEETMNEETKPVYDAATRLATAEISLVHAAVLKAAGIDNPLHFDAAASAARAAEGAYAKAIADYMSATFEKVKATK